MPGGPTRPRASELPPTLPVLSQRDRRPEHIHHDDGSPPLLRRCGRTARPKPRGPNRRGEGWPCRPAGVIGANGIVRRARCGLPLCGGLPQICFRPGSFGLLGLLSPLLSFGPGFLLRPPSCLLGRASLLLAASRFRAFGPRLGAALNRNRSGLPRSGNRPCGSSTPRSTTGRAASHRLKLRPATLGQFLQTSASLIVQIRRTRWGLHRSQFGGLVVSDSCGAAGPQHVHAVAFGRLLGRLPLLIRPQLTEPPADRREPHKQQDDDQLGPLLPVHDRAMIPRHAHAPHSRSSPSSPVPRPYPEPP